MVAGGLHDRAALVCDCRPGRLAQPAVSRERAGTCVTCTCVTCSVNDLREQAAVGQYQRRCAGAAAPVAQRPADPAAGSWSIASPGPPAATAWRLLSQLDETLAGLRAARAQARVVAWAQHADTRGRTFPQISVAGQTVEGLVLDLDATIVLCHSEKEAATRTWQKTFGYHPLFCFLDNTGEALSGLLREGRAGSNTTADHITVLDQALAQIPDEHRHGVPILARRSPVCQALGHSDNTKSSTLARRRCRLRTICGSNVPDASRGTRTCTGPTSVSTVFVRLPLRVFPPPLPTGSCLS